MYVRTMICMEVCVCEYWRAHALLNMSADTWRKTPYLGPACTPSITCAICRARARPQDSQSSAWQALDLQVQAFHEHKEVLYMRARTYEKKCDSI